MRVQSMVTRCCRRPDHWTRQTAMPLGAAPSIASITSGSRKARAIPPACSSNSWKSTLPELSIASTSSRSTPMSARPTAPLASRITIARPGVALTGRLPKPTRQAPSGVAPLGRDCRETTGLACGCETIGALFRNPRCAGGGCVAVARDRTRSGATTVIGRPHALGNRLRFRHQVVLPELWAALDQDHRKSPAQPSITGPV